MADYVVTQRYEMDNAVSAGADAAAASLNKMADAADTAVVKITAGGRSANQFANALDPITKAIAGVTAAERQLTQMQTAFSDSLAKGEGDADAFTRALSAQQDKVDQARLKLAGARGELQALPPATQAAVSAVASLGSAHDKAGVSAGAQAFALRQLGVQSVQAISGIASGQPVLTTFVQQGHQVLDVALSTGAGFSVLTGAAAAVFGAVATIPGVLGTLALGLGYAAYSAEAAQRSLVELSVHLRATRDDYSSLAAEVERSSRIIGSQGITSTGDAASAGAVIAASRDFTGNAADLQNLITLSADVARSFDEGIVPAAGRVAAALKSPKDAAQALADQGLRTMGQGLVDTIARLDDQGQHALAAKMTLDALAASVGGAASSMTPLQKALHDLQQSFTTSDNAGRAWGQTIGDAVAGAAASAIDSITGVINRLHDLRSASASSSGSTPRLDLPKSTYPVLPNGQIAPAVPGDYADSLPGSISIGSFIQREGQIAGLSQNLTNLASRILVAESGGNQFAANGDVLTSSAGAIGLMQVQPATRDRFAPGMNLDIPQQNIRAGLQVIAGLSNLPEINGDPTKIAAAYNMGDQGFRDVLAGKRTLPNETLDFVQKTTGAMMTNSFTSAAPYGPPDPTQAQLSASQYQQTQIDRGLKLADTIGSPGMTKDALTDQLTKLKALQDQVAAGTPQWQKYQQAIETTSGALYKSGDPIQQYIKGLNEQLPPLQANEGGARAVAEAQNALTQASLAAGRAPSDAERYAVQTAALTKLNAALGDNLAQLDRQYAGQQLTIAGYDDSSAAGLHAANQARAQVDALKYSKLGYDDYGEAVKALTTRYDQASQAASDLQTAQQVLQDKNQLEYLAKESELIGATVEQRDKELAILKVIQDQITRTGNADSPQAKALIGYTGQISDATTALNLQKQAIQDLQGMATQAFDQVGSAIANAFVSGSGQAVNFGNVASSVMSSVLQQILKLSVINPILNSVLGTSNTTLLSAINAVSAVNGGGVSAGASSSTSSLSSLSGLSSLTNLFTSSSGSLSPALDAFAQSTFGFGGISNFAGQSAGAIGPFQGAGLLNGGVGSAGFGSLSNILGIGGSILPGLLSGNIGQAASGGIGAAIGTAILPGIGTAIGGVLGNLVGGVFGPGPAHHGFSYTYEGQPDGSIGYGPDRQYIDPVVAAQFDAEKAQVAQDNAYLASAGLQASGRIVVGGNNNDPTQAASLSAGFDRLSFGSASDTLLNTALSGKSFASITDLQTAVTAVQTFEQTLPGLLDPLNKSSSAAGTLQAALDQLNTTYGNAITQAASYGRATDDLAQAQAAAIQAHREAADKSVQQTLQGFAERALNATSGGSLAASLLAFDDQAQQQRDAFSSQLTSLYGAAYASTTSYVAQTLTLEQTLSAERLKITQQYYDQGRQQVLSVVQSLTGYTRSLALSSASPLSAQDQYAYAQNEFGTTSAGALGGSFTDLQQLQQAAQDLLTASRAINGSGAQYAADYAQVTSVLGGIAGAPSDQLTASAMSSIQQSVTDQLTAALGALGATITGATLTNGVQTAASIYSGINGLTMSLAAANTDSIDQLIANFSQVASTISTSTTAALDEAALSRVMDYQTTRVVTALQDVEDAINALRAEIMHQAAAPSMPISYGSGSGGGGDGGSGG